MTSHKEILAEFKAGCVTMDQLEKRLDSGEQDRFWEQCAIAALSISVAPSYRKEAIQKAFETADAMLAERNRRLLQQAIERANQKKALDAMARDAEEIRLYEKRKHEAAHGRALG